MFPPSHTPNFLFTETEKLGKEAQNETILTTAANWQTDLHTTRSRAYTVTHTQQPLMHGKLLNAKCKMQITQEVWSQLYSALEIMRPQWWSRDFYVGASNGQANFSQKTIFSTKFFPTYMTKHTLFTMNPRWETMNPFAFRENGDFLALLLTCKKEIVWDSSMKGTTQRECESWWCTIEWILYMILSMAFHAWTIL